MGADNRASAGTSNRDSSAQPAVVLESSGRESRRELRRLGEALAERGTSGGPEGCVILFAHLTITNGTVDASDFIVF